MTMEKYDTLKYLFYEKCRHCGILEVWPHGNAKKLHLCRECYRAHAPKEFEEYQSRAYKQPYFRLRDLLYERLIREYHRTNRIKNGIVEPFIVCLKCKTRKPLFEFPPRQRLEWPDGFKNLLCYDCKSLIDERGICPECKKAMEYEDFYNEVDDYGYRSKYCKKCVLKERLFLETVKKSVWQNSLKSRGLKKTKANIKLITELILAKRIKNKVQEKLRRGEL